MSSKSIPTEPGPERARAFVAVSPAPAVARAIEDFQSELRPLGADVAWVRPANFHLTLRFLGPAVPSEILERLGVGMAEIARHCTPFDLRAAGAGAFPSLSRARTLWVGLESTELRELAQALEPLAAASGLKPQAHPFTPHLSIGRVRRPPRDPRLRNALGAAAQRQFGVCRIDSVTLFQSTLAPGGAIYQPRLTLSLGG